MQYTLINPIKRNERLITQILLNRGIPNEQLQSYLEVSAAQEFFPTMLDNINAAVAMLQKHLAKPTGRIYVQVDSDFDGYSSAALLLNYIYKLVPSAISKFYYGLHETKTHGININNITPDTTLVIAPDSSSNEYEIHQQLKEQGIDVLVLDHHHADKISPYACIVNNQLCSYPNKHLSGVGIVYKFCQHIDQLLGVNHAHHFIDLVATGLVGDMMDLRNLETHYLVQEGLSQPFTNEFLKHMAIQNAYSLGETITPIGVAFYIVPYVNAVTRTGSMSDKTLLFESLLDYKALEEIPSTKRGCKGQLELRVTQSIRTCMNVKKRQTDMRDSQQKIIERIIQEENLLENKLLLIRLSDKNINRSILGLMANELMSKYQRPVAIMIKTEHDGQPAWEGSARGYEKSSLADFRKFVLESNLTYLAEGHSNAFGIGIYADDFDTFVNWSNEQLKNVEFSPAYRVDLIYDPKDSHMLEAISEIAQYEELWGQNVDEPLIAVARVNITKDMITLMSPDRKPTLKIQLPNGVSCIKFKSNEEEFNRLCSNQGCVTVDFIGRASENHYRNSVTPQLIITDYEIVDKQEYYF